MYGIQDILVYDRLDDDLKSLGPETTCFIGHNIAKKRAIDEKWIEYPLNTAYHDYDKTVLNKLLSPKYFSNKLFFNNVTAIATDLA